MKNQVKKFPSLVHGENFLSLWKTSKIKIHTLPFMKKLKKYIIYFTFLARYREQTFRDSF